MQGNVWTFMASMGGHLDERSAVPLVLEPTMSALAHIHSLGVIHRGEHIRRLSTAEKALGSCRVAAHCMEGSRGVRTQQRTLLAALSTPEWPGGPLWHSPWTPHAWTRAQRTPSSLPVAQASSCFLAECADIKPENLLINSSFQVKLAGEGLH